jgi:hypothetical protein
VPDRPPPGTGSSTGGAGRARMCRRPGPDLARRGHAARPLAGPPTWFVVSPACICAAPAPARVPILILSAVALPLLGDIPGGPPETPRVSRAGSVNPEPGQGRRREVGRRATGMYASILPRLTQYAAASRRQRRGANCSGLSSR